MTFIGFALLQICFWILWGVSIGVWLLPQGWRRHLWAISISIGLSLQVTLAWIVVFAGGTVGEIAKLSHLLPIICLAIALTIRRRRWLLWATLSSRETRVMFSLVVLATCCSLLPTGVFSPLAHNGLSTISIGSHDAPDYALGGRLLLEKGKHLTNGFWAQDEVHQFGEALNIWTFWTRLNHFGPAAILAFTAGTFDLPMWKLGTVLSAAIGAAGAGLCFTVARAVFRTPLRSALLIGTLYSISPLWMYAVYHVAIGQLMGTLALSALLLLASAIPNAKRRMIGIRHCIIGAILVGLLVGSYPIMIVYAAAGCIGMAVIRSLQLRSPRYALRTTLWLGIACLATAAVFPTRFYALITTVIYFGGGLFGWAMPPMHLSSMLGMTRGSEMNPLPPAFSMMFGTIVVLYLVFGLFQGWRKGRMGFATALVIVAIVLGSRTILTALDPADSNWASYKVYKAVAVFLPTFLPSVFIGLSYQGLIGRRFTTACVLAVMVVIPAVSLRTLWHPVARASMRTGPELEELSRAESDPEITGVNIVATRLWDRIWSSTLLAEKKQYFSESTYTARGIVELRGDWVLEDAFCGIYSENTKHVGTTLILRPTGAPPKALLSFGEGWWSDEGTHRWSGSAGNKMEFKIDAASDLLIAVSLAGTFLEGGPKVEAFINRDPVEVRQAGGKLVMERVPVPHGISTLMILVDSPPLRGPNPQDPRTLLYKMFSVEMQEVRHPTEPSS